jgi:hypothetical protein
VRYFDGPSGIQVPRQVADAIAATMVSGISNRGTFTFSQRREWCAPGHPDLPRCVHHFAATHGHSTSGEAPPPIK